MGQWFHSTRTGGHLVVMIGLQLVHDVDQPVVHLAADVVQGLLHLACAMDRHTDIQY